MNGITLQSSMYSKAPPPLPLVLGWGEQVPPATRFAPLADSWTLHSGARLRKGRIAYETLNDDNSVLILTGLAPDAHIASHEADPSPGWWEKMVGPGKPIDTSRWFVICVNTLGSCKGSTGPASIDPDSGLIYGHEFPELSIEDMADAAAQVLDHLGIAVSACVIGTSMGGMSALSFLVRHPGRAASHINISGAAEASTFAIAIRSLQREAIRNDPKWQNGHYTQDDYPLKGMLMARKLGVISYRSAVEWEGRFGRRKLDPTLSLMYSKGQQLYEIESYLDHQAHTFARSFDPNCYLYLSSCMDRFSIKDEPQADLSEGLAPAGLLRALVLGVDTDILFPPEQQQDIAEALSKNRVDCRYQCLPCTQGHDSFLIDYSRFGPQISRFLRSI